MLLRPMNNLKKIKKKKKKVKNNPGSRVRDERETFPYCGNCKRQTARTNGQNDTRMTETEQEKKTCPVKKLHVGENK